MLHNIIYCNKDYSSLEGISFKVNRGEVFGFLGLNGAGKTTTIRMMIGKLSNRLGLAIESMRRCIPTLLE